MTSIFKNEADIVAALQLIKQANNITLLTHYNPDGDGISACAALEYVLLQYGKTVETVYPTKTEEAIKRQSKKILIGKHEQIPDLIITTDTSVYARLYYPECFKGIPLINIDHHMNNEIQGTFNFVSVDVSSTCEMLYLLLQTWAPPRPGFDPKKVETYPPIQIDTYVGECLLYGILYDTQNFYNQATRPVTLRVAAEIMQYQNVNLTMLQQELICNKSPEIISFWGTLLNSVSFTPNKNAAWITITQQDLTSRGLTLSSTVGFSNFLAQLSEVDITVLFYESEDGKSKASLRSKYTDVNAIAGKFGGGGHKNASGITSTKPFNEFVNEVTQALEE